MDVYVCGSGFKTPVAATVEIDEVEENNDFARGDKRALKVDALLRKGIWGPEPGYARPRQSRTPNWQVQD